MKNKILLIISLFILAICITSCKKDKLTNFDKLVQAIYSSEEKLSAYKENTLITDNGLEVYSKKTDCLIQRGSTVKTEVSSNEKVLSTSGDRVYDENSTSYRTVGNVMYEEINGTYFETGYTVPTYYLTFVLSEEFLIEGYTLTADGNDFELIANVYDDKISSLFLNKSLGAVSNLSIHLVVKNNELLEFDAKYKTENGLDASIETEYSYAEKGTAKAVFYLEGGTCQNSKNKVTYLYDFDGTKDSIFIVDPNVLIKNPQDQIIKNGYHIEGWYQTKQENPDGTVEYKDKWDFAKDKMSLDGITLYAKWEVNKSYTYELYYKNALGEDVFLDKYEVKEGEKFSDLFLKNKDVEGYTSLGYLDESGNTWDEEFTHPGGDSDLAVKLYLNLIEGEYTVVKTARQFKTALTRNENIYLLNDIDLNNEAICYTTYSGIIMGRGYKVKNFEIDYDSTKNGLQGSLDDINGSEDHLYISLFFELKDALLKDVIFEGVKIRVNTDFSNIKYMIIAPLAIKAENVTLENVTFCGTIEYKKLPECELSVELENFWYKDEGENSVDESTILDILNTTESSVD